MNRWTRFIEWCQRPSKIKVRSFNPRNAVVLVTVSIILASSITFGTWSYLAASAPPIPDINRDNYETLFPTLTITEDTTLTEDHSGHIIIAADDITLDGNGHTITGPGWWMWNSTQRMWDVATGIKVKGRTGVTIKNCRVTNFWMGFWLHSSDGNTLLNNTASENVFNGFLLAFSSNNTLMDNTAFGSQDVLGDGFTVEMSFGNIFKSNVAHDNGLGFTICEFEKEIFEEERGFTLKEYEGNVFEANTAKANTRAGFYIGGIDDTFSNVFFHNNLIDNTIQAGVLLGSTNTWDDGYPSGGNYWSDYKGVDADGDGIGDTPHVIRSVSWEEYTEEGDEPFEPFLVLGEPDGNNTDRYPLIAPING